MLNAQKVENLEPLTSLRFIAAMMIVVYHAKLYFPWKWAIDAPSTLVQGVSFFFVLSGFILTHVYTSKPFPGYQQFMRARFARIWPVHVFSLLVLVTFVRPDSITFDGTGVFSKWVQLGFNLTLTHAIMPFTSFAFSWNAVSWSISTEAFFYFAFPLLLINIRRTWHLKLLGAMLSVVLVALILKVFRVPVAAGVDQVSLTMALYSNPLVRGFEFCLGMATWVLWDRHIKHATSLDTRVWTAIELSVVAAIVGWLGWGFYLVMPNVRFASATILFGQAGSCWLFAILIAVIASGRGAFGKALARRPFVFLGEISFSLYMLHQILMKFFSGWLPHEAVTPVMFFAALMFVASGSYLMIEKPAQRYLMRKRVLVGATVPAR